MATFYLDYENGNDANDGLSFANRWKTITSGATAARIAPGDTIRVMKSPDPTSLGINATWTNKSTVVMLASALNALVNDGEAAWTASANVTCTKSTATYRTGTGSARQQIAAGFTTGKVAYFGLGASNDYSGYQGITFWIFVNAALAASTLELRLCSDTTGDTAVDTFAIPAISQANQWVPLYLDKGSALGSAIQSIALHAVADPGTIDVYLDNISTVKAAGNDNLNLQSLIGKNTAGETWFALREINGTTLRIDQSPSMLVSSLGSIRGYYGTTETVTTYKRETIKLGLVASNGTNHSVQDSGSAGSVILFSGGWDRTAMTTQDGETWWDQQSGVGTVLSVTARSYIQTEKINGVRGEYGLAVVGGSNNCVLGDGHFNHNLNYGLSVNGSNLNFGTMNVWNNGIAGVGGSGGAFLSFSTVAKIIANCNATVTSGRGILMGNIKNSIITEVQANYNTNDGWGHLIGIDTLGMRIGTCTCKDNGRYGFVLDDEGYGELDIGALTCTGNASEGLYLGGAGLRNVIRSYTSSGNGLAGIFYAGGTAKGDVAILASSIAEATPIRQVSFGGNVFKGRFTLHNFNGAAGSHRAYFNGGNYTVFSETGADRHTASGIAWKISPLNSTEVTSDCPAKLTLATLAVNASALVTVRAFVKRDNTGLTAKLVCRGGQIAGVSSDVVDTITASAGTWEELEITFTPSEAGVVEIELHVYGGTSYNCWVDDMTVLQA